MMLLENSIVLLDRRHQHWLHFRTPHEVLSTDCLAEVPVLLATVQQAVQQGAYAAGFLSYEAAPAFDPCLAAADPEGLPLTWFGLYDPPEAIALPPAPAGDLPLAWQPDCSRSEYQAAIARIKHYIARGDTYQVNFSYRLRAAFRGDPWTYFQHLIAAQACQYGAFVNLPDWAICSASPELFFRWQGNTLTCCPMKGTAPRGLTAVGDRQLQQQLQTSPKERAENLMIVDMIRNDLGRIAQIGSVHVPHLFTVEQYPTVWQLTSPVTCTTTARFPDIMAALFPCASITGAPKVRTTQIIRELETSPRRIYTGSLGFLTPEPYAQFNVAIRTVLIDKRQAQAEYGVGGGIVWDSEPEPEWAECAVKARVLTQRRPAFALLETLRWQPATGYFLLDLHLQRLAASAAYFAFPWDQTAICDRLQQLTATFAPTPQRVRLRLTAQGALHLEATPLDREERSRPWRLGLAPTPIDVSDVFLYHKTTARHVYQQARQARPDCDDTLLWNPQGELTETCCGNLVVELDGSWYTPPVDCGLLAGTYRAWLLQQGKLQERRLTRADLDRSTGLWIINSVRQRQPAQFVASPPP